MGCFICNIEITRLAAGCFTPCNDFGQVVHIRMPLSQRSKIWYWLKDGNAMRMGSSPVGIAVLCGKILWICVVFG